MVDRHERYGIYRRAPRFSTEDLNHLVCKVLHVDGTDAAAYSLAFKDIVCHLPLRKRWGFDAIVNDVADVLVFHDLYKNVTMSV